MEPKFNQIILIDIAPEHRITPEWRQRVVVVGETELPYSRPFDARFDDQDLEGLALDTRGTGFTGYLTSAPAEGAKLIVEFEGQDPIDTGLTFSSGNGGIA